MTYERINFVDQSVERPRTYEMTHNADGSITLTDSFGLVNELGTPINAETMNHIEDGIDSKQDQLIAGENIILENNVISAKSGSLPIGEIISLNCSPSYVPEGCLPCDGTEYTQAQFNDLWTNYIETGYLNTCSYTEYETEIATNGQCAKFAVDVDNLKFRVPLIKDGAVIQQALSDSELGKSYNAGLPNIQGILSNENDSSVFYDNSSTVTGCFYRENIRNDQGYTLVNTLSSKFDLGFDASLSSPIYGNSETVQMNAVALRYFVVVANGSINQSMMDWSAWASGLQGKLNADHSNDAKPYVIEISDKTILPSWYRIWSNGFCEQGGLSLGGSTTTGASVSLIYPYKDENYTLVSSINSTSFSNTTVMWAKVGNKTSSSFSLQTGHNVSTGAEYFCSWEAKGYIN